MLHHAAADRVVEAVEEIAREANGNREPNSKLPN
jgi:hypothetical protein